MTKTNFNTTKNVTKRDFSNTLAKYSNADNVKNGIAYYGKYNDLPQKYLNLLDDSSENSVSSTWHGIAVEAIVKYTQGDGLIASNNQELPLANNFNETFNEVFEKTAWDYKLYGGFAIEVIWNNETVAGISNPKIAEIYQIPFKDIRAKEKNYRGLIEGWYVSSKWKKIKDPKNTEVEFIPVFNPNVAGYSETANAEPQPKQILVVKRHNPASEYYPEPDYKSALTDIGIDSESRRFKINKLRDATATNLIIQFVGNMDPEEYAEIANDFQEQYQGADNAGPILLNVPSAAEAHIITTPSNSKGQAESYNSYSEDARQRILSAHGITFGEIVGIDDGNSLFGDEKAEKYQTFLNTTIRDVQMPMLSGYNKLMPYILGEAIDLQINPIDIFAGMDSIQDNVTDGEEDTNDLLNTINNG